MELQDEAIGMAISHRGKIMEMAQGHGGIANPLPRDLRVRRLLCLLVQRGPPVRAANVFSHRNLQISGRRGMEAPAIGPQPRVVVTIGDPVVSHRISDSLLLFVSNGAQAQLNSNLQVL